MKHYLAWLVALAVASLSVVSCTSILGGFQASGTGPDASTGDDATSPDGNSNGDGHGGAANGSACTTGTACESGNCADGVCCNNACSGTCESCSVMGHVGTCTGYAVNTDPASECLSVSEREALEAGAEDGGVTADAGAAADGGDATVEGGDAKAPEDAAGDAGDASHPHDAEADALADAASDAQVYNLPDGAASNDKSCAGSCNGMGGNGQGACVYPSSTTSCGSAWCNTPSEAANFACNSQGGCGITSTDCGKYACESNACVSSCSAPTDCSDTDYCNTSTTPGTCTPKLGNGAGCTTPTECLSGACTNQGDPSSSLICCSSACTDVPGGTCFKTTATTGQCECNIDCSDAGSCVLWYKDLDGDGYGNKAVTMVGCSGETPPSTWVTNDTDCDDTASTGPNAFPGQTAYFGYPDPNNTSSAYDYNCDGTEEKSVPEEPGQSCEYCVGTEPACTVSYTCTAASGTQSGFGCQVDQPTICFIGGACNAYCGNIETGSLFFKTDLTTAFTATVACGAYANTTTCGTCAATGDYPATTLTDTQQTCH